MALDAARRWRHPVRVSHEAEEHHAAEGGDHAADVDVLEPPDELAPDEPRTPLWLTMLGGGLCLLLAIVWLAARPADQTLSELAPPALASAPEFAAPTPPPVVVPPVVPPPAAPPSLGPTPASPSRQPAPKPAGRPTKAKAPKP